MTGRLTDGSDLGPTNQQQGAAPAGGWRRFLVGLFVAAAAIVLAVGAFNALVDPYGVVGTSLFPVKTMPDREIKAELVEDLDKPPDVLILGSSRAFKLSPKLISQRTGRRAFNASVSGGKPIDMWAFTNLVHDRFPEAEPDFIWVFDVTEFVKSGIAAGTRNTASLRRYHSWRELYGSSLDDVDTLISWTTLQTSINNLRNLPEHRAAAQKERKKWTSTGLLKDTGGQRRANRTMPIPKIEYHIREKGEIYGRYERLDPRAQRYLERVLGLYASWDGSGVIVIAPTEPRLVAELQKVGYDARYREALAYLKTLQKRYGFTLVDFSTVDKYGGSSREFQDGVHLRTPGMEHLFDEVLKKTGGTIP